MKTAEQAKGLSKFRILCRAVFIAILGRTWPTAQATGWTPPRHLG